MVPLKSRQTGPTAGAGLRRLPPPVLRVVIRTVGIHTPPAEEGISAFGTGQRAGPGHCPCARCGSRHRRLVACSYQAATVRLVDIIVIAAPTDHGNYRLLSALSEQQTELVTLREDMAIDELENPPDFLTDFAYDDDEQPEDYHAVSVRAIEEVEFGCWWFTEDVCSGELNCRCGPATLLEVLSRTTDPKEQTAAIGAHLARMSDLWAHYWAGDSLISGSQTDFEDSCADCIIEGLFHVGAVYEAASTLAQELGEALAAYHSAVRLGDPRWPA